MLTRYIFSTMKQLLSMFLSNKRISQCFTNVLSYLYTLLRFLPNWGSEGTPPFSTKILFTSKSSSSFIYLPFKRTVFQKWMTRIARVSESIYSKYLILLHMTLNIFSFTFWVKLYYINLLNVVIPILESSSVQRRRWLLSTSRSILRK